MDALISLGTASYPSSSPQFEGSLPLLGLGQVSLAINFATFRRAWILKRQTFVLCKYSVTTDYVVDQGTSSVSFNDYTPYRVRKRDADRVGLKPSPRPILTSGLKVDPLLGMNSVAWNSLKVNGHSEDKKINVEEQERIMVIESLGEAMEKTEKIEASKKVVATFRKPPTPNTRTDQSNGKTVNKTALRKSKTLKSVWRKENPIATVEKEVKRLPVNKKVERPNIDVLSKIDSPPVSSLRPSEPFQRVRLPSQRVRLPSQRVRRPSQKVQLKLQIKHSIAPPSGMNIKPVILKDMGASTRAPATIGTSLDAMAEEHKPILIDRFVSKQATIDPLLAQSTLAPPKPRKSSAPGRFNDDFPKKSGTSGGPRRHMTNDIDIPDDEASELDVSIPGAPTARKGRKWSKASRKAARRQAAREAEPVKAEILEVAEDGMSTEELACNLTISEGEILGFLYAKGIKPDGVQTLDKDMVKMVCEVYDVEVIGADPVRVEEMAKKKEIFDKEDLGKLENRPPVLTIMGHVDHGKTTLLDHLRKTKVAASEAGGITQKIGAYKVQVPIDGKLRPFVFLDTPGHEAFGAMRARGARVTDIAIIVVAADDGIKPQTNEAVAHAKAAGVPIVIAINKIDKDGANPDRVMQELSSIGLMPDDWGGDIPVVQISALKGKNIDDLLETVILIAELQELKANSHRNAKGTVIEAGLDKSKGPVATFIIQNGTLKRGDIIVCGEAFGKVRALFDDGGKRVDEVGPSIPIQVIGLNNVPFAGDEFEVVDSLDIARTKAELRAECIRDERISAKAGDGKITLSSFASAISSRKHAGLDLHQLVIILKVDLQGSIEAIRQALQVLPHDNVTLKFLLQATGEVSNSDVDLAVASKAIIFGFNVRAPGPVKRYAENKGVEIRLYRVIYELIDDMRTAMEGLLDPVEDQVPIGSLEVRAVFHSGSGRAAGCMVTEGKVVKDSGIRVIRKGKTVFVGIIDSLRRIKEAVKEVSVGLECGIGIHNFGDWEVGDILVAFITVKKNRTLEEASALMTAAFEEVRIEGS